MPQALCVSGVVMLSNSEALYPAGALVSNHGALSPMLEMLIVLFANWQMKVMGEAVLDLHHSTLALASLHSSTGAP
jgi:hypothetical protein